MFTLHWVSLDTPLTKHNCVWRAEAGWHCLLVTITHYMELHQYKQSNEPINLLKCTTKTSMWAHFARQQQHEYSGWTLQQVKFGKTKFLQRHSMLTEEIWNCSDFWKGNTKLDFWTPRKHQWPFWKRTNYCIAQVSKSEIFFSSFHLFHDF